MAAELIPQGGRSSQLDKVGGRVQGAVEARNRDYANIVRSLNFVSKGWYDPQVMADAPYPLCSMMLH